MINSFEDDARDLCNFLKEHKDIKSLKIDKAENTIIVNIETVENSTINWTLIHNAFEQYFNLKHEFNLQITSAQEPKKKIFLEDEDLVIVSKPRQPVQPIVVFSTDRRDWKLFRFYSQSGKPAETNYFEPRAEIAEKEISNLEDTYNHILVDMKKREFTRNIIELNVNCLNSNELKGKYIETLRRLPIQLKNRIAISLVRIPQDASIHVLRQAALICKLCTDNIFLSFPYQGILSEQKLKQIYGISGYVITIPKGTLKSADEVSQTYDKLNSLFPDKRTFVIFNDEKDFGTSFRSSRVVKLVEQEKIGVEE